MTEDDPREAIELENAAEARLRKVDADPADTASADAAQHLIKLANEVRQLRDAPLYQEYLAICNWLDEFDGMADFEIRAYELRSRTGFGGIVKTGEQYLRTLIELAKESF
ncbi:MAG: hypothetical protein JO227_12355 [Acetobacteraceae bacterium]|nr:hypothetical protein [Acetobacteraceae bacterium]